MFVDQELRVCGDELYLISLLSEQQLVNIMCQSLSGGSIIVQCRWQPVKIITYLNFLSV
jgi:hypothetical protein